MGKEEASSFISTPSMVASLACSSVGLVWGESTKEGCDDVCTFLWR